MAITVQFDPNNMYSGNPAKRTRIENEVKNFQRIPAAAALGVIRYDRRLPKLSIQSLTSKPETAHTLAGATEGSISQSTSTIMRTGTSPDCMFPACTDAAWSDLRFYYLSSDWIVSIIIV
jgi:hypothetical protein